MNLEDLYKSFASNKDSRELLLQTHWLASLANFDPKTGEALPLALSETLRRISTRKPESFVRDRLWLLTEHSRESALRLMRSLSEEPRRESAYLPIRDVREMDTASLIALSRRPGRNLREKLANKPYMQAPRHFLSIDVPENQLLKAYLEDLAEALELRRKHLKDTSVEGFLEAIYRWLFQDEIQEISRWKNIAPNNALLSHRGYRRIWNSWRRLQTIGEDITRDMKLLQERRATKAKWETLAKRSASEGVAFADMPVFVDFDRFKLEPWDASLPHKSAGKAERMTKVFETSEPVCIDISQLRPVWATPTQSGDLPDTFFWQRWSNEGCEVDLELFESDAIFCSHDATTLTASDLLFTAASSGEAKVLLNQAARAFALRLKRHFKNNALTWLVPDSVNEFELETVRRNLNAAFSQAEPLPCSVASVFKHIDYASIAHDGYKVGVIENVNGCSYQTELVARFDEELLDALPETRGYAWEKGISECIKEGLEADRLQGPVPLLSWEGTWIDFYNPYGAAHAKTEDAVWEYEGFDLLIWLNTRPVEGGAKLQHLQSKAPNLSLWRNHIPELMTRVMKDGYYQPFYFVGKDVTVSPIRGKAVPIKVPEQFTLPAKRRSYRLPLLQGRGEDVLEYEAKLVSKDFPYTEDVPCRLEMTYTHGADDPYRLVFHPLDAKYKPINVIWQPKEEVEIDDAPGPEFPKPLTWDELQHQISPKTGERSDFLDWALGAAQRMVKLLENKPVAVEISSYWRTNASGAEYNFGIMPNGDSVYLNEHAFPTGRDVYTYTQGDSVQIYPDYSSKGISAFIAEASADELSQSVCSRIRRTLYVPFISIWKGGHSISEADCPTAFREGMPPLLHAFEALCSDRQVPKAIRSELAMLLACAAADLSPQGQALMARLSNENILRGKVVGFALGDLSAQWQLALLDETLQAVPGRAVTALAHAAWRNKDFVSHLSLQHVKAALDLDRSELEDLAQADSLNDLQQEYLMRCLELLLGLLRLRNLDDPEMHMLLQPSQPICKDFANLIERVTALVARQGYALPSRINLDVSSRPADDKTPDLLYALRIYLAGDDAAGAIRVTGVVDDDE